MGFKESIAKLFKRDKGEQAAAAGKGSTLDDPTGSATRGDVLSHVGSVSLTSALSLDQALMQRYADYEGMDDYPELSAALTIFADDSTITDSVRGKTIWAESRDKVLRDIIDDLLHRRLRIEEDIWIAVRTLVKYGNLFAEIVVTEKGVVGLNYLPTPTVRRLVNDKGDLIGYVQDMSGKFNIPASEHKSLNDLKAKLKERKMTFFEPWEVVHWRMRSKYVHSLYGFSVIDASRWVWKRLVMLEDTSLLYQLTRSPGRYVFYIDTGDLPPQEANALVKKAMRGYKKRTLVNTSTGELEFRRNPLSPEDDVFIPTRGQKESTRVDVLSGPTWESNESLEYWRDKMFTTITIPRSYYGGDAEAEQGLAQKDVRFARTCLRVQREWRNGIRQIVRVHLAALNIDPDSVDWETRMTMPSSIFELQQIEVMNAQAGLIETLSQYLPVEWLIEKVLHMSKDEAVTISNGKDDEVEKKANHEARIAAMIQQRYPGVDVPVGDEPPAPDGQSEDVDVSKKIDTLKEVVKETRQTSNRMIKRIEEIEPKVRRTIRREVKRQAAPRGAKKVYGA